MIEEKRNKIKNSLRITRERRKTQDVIILKLKNLNMMWITLQASTMGS